MIINRPGAVFDYNGIQYVIGEPIIGTAESEYEGLIGSITEIYDGDDKETENETPDFYCCFEAPIHPHDIKVLEERFSDLYDEPRTLDDITLDMVIMAPSMVMPVRHIKNTQCKIPIFIVCEDWTVKGENGHSQHLFTDYQDARCRFHELLAEELMGGSLADWRDSEKLQVESGKDFYECWIEDEYFENHYKLSITADFLCMSASALGSLGRSYNEQCYMEDFASQVESWDEVVGMTEEQRSAFLKDTSIPERIHKALGRNDHYWECYWETVSEVAHEILKTY